MNTHFSAFLCRELAERKQTDAAAMMGITPSQLNKAMKGKGCERTTLTRIFAGISTNQSVRARCVIAHLKDIASLAGPDGALIEIHLTGTLPHLRAHGAFNKDAAVLTA